MIHLDYRDPRPIYSQIVDGFREQILSGILQAGEKLPSVRDLAGNLTINPNTIQRAYRELESQGWIHTVPGKGCFVSGGAGTEDLRQAELLHTFDRTVAALLAMGISRAALRERLNQGGNDHA